MIKMDNKKMLQKIEPFLLEIYNETVIKNNKKIKLRHILIKHKMSDSSRVALSECKILKKNNYGSAAEYIWIHGLPDQKLCYDFLEKVKEINKRYILKYRSPAKKNISVVPKKKEVKSYDFLPAAILLGLLILIRKLLK